MKTIEELGISPAPWSINEDGEVWCKYISNAIQPNKIRTRVVARPNFYFDESKSDAHLIAAAPKLYKKAYEVAENLLVHLAVPTQTITMNRAEIAAMYKDLLAALAEAAGESEASK